MLKHLTNVQKLIPLKMNGLVIVKILLIKECIMASRKFEVKNLSFLNMKIKLVIISKF
jgi:hypothetical protein